MAQIYKPWVPISGLQFPMYVEGIYDDYEGFRILLRGEQSTSQTLRVSFKTKLSYRVSDESYLLATWDSIEKDALGKIFYVVENSVYIGSFNTMSRQIYADWPIAHYAIYTTADCLDILTTTKPISEWLN